ncbi:MAG: hypothetical protein K0S39_1163 [Paenibacillus sp.]|nr:hypothetical protein [Paenibacillus sp.]
MLGIVLILLIVIRLMQKHRLASGGLRGLHRPLPVLIIGITGGFIGAVFAVGGPFFVMYFLTKYTDKREYNVNLQLLFLLLILQTVTLHYVSGGLDQMFYTYLLLGVPVVLLGAYAGMRWFERFDRMWIERFAFVIILASGIQLLL